MSSRNFSPQAMFKEWAKKHIPQCSFAGSSGNDFKEWKAETFPKVISTLGDFTAKTALNPQLVTEFMHDGLKKQRWLIDVGQDISAALLINYPPGLNENDKYPAILCCHGHGIHGKEPVMGNDSSASLRTDIERMNYDYGHRMAQAGFITFSIDWIGFGERNDSQKPNYTGNPGGRDWCNIYYLHATMFGTTSIAINVMHGSAAVDFVSSLNTVDSGRIGVMGLSGGGTMATWMKLCDQRLKAAEIICYSNLWEDFGISDTNYCGMQVAPGLYKLVDLPDLQGLIAPSPLLIDIGLYDSCFRVDSAIKCYNKLEKIYKAAGAADKLELDLFPGEHAWGANKSVDFFKKYL